MATKQNQKATARTNYDFSSRRVSKGEKWGFSWIRVLRGSHERWLTDHCYLYNLHQASPCVKALATRKLGQGVESVSPDTMMAAFSIHILMRSVSLSQSFLVRGESRRRLQWESRYWQVLFNTLPAQGERPVLGHLSWYLLLSDNETVSREESSILLWTIFKFTEGCSAQGNHLKPKSYAF